MTAKLAALAGLVSGVALILTGGGVPVWLANMLAVSFSALALLYGFTAFVPSAPRWLTSPPVIGIASIWSGCAISWEPANIVMSSLLIGFGSRMLMIERHKLSAEPHDAGVREIVPRDCQRGSELARRDLAQPPAHRRADQDLPAAL